MIDQIMIREEKSAGTPPIIPPRHYFEHLIFEN